MTILIMHNENALALNGLCSFANRPVMASLKKLKSLQCNGPTNASKFYCKHSLQCFVNVNCIYCLPVRWYSLHSHSFPNQKMDVTEDLVVEQESKPFLNCTFCGLPVVNRLTKNQHRRRGCCTVENRGQTCGRIHWGCGGGWCSRHIWCRGWCSSNGCWRKRSHGVLTCWLPPRVLCNRRSSYCNIGASTSVRAWMGVCVPRCPRRPISGSHRTPVACGRRMGTVARLSITQRSAVWEI